MSPSQALNPFPNLGNGTVIYFQFNLMIICH